MELNQVKYALAVMKAGSFTAAAETCGVSQPGLTKSIRTLERELGGRLFHREGNRLLVTELGRTMAPIFERMAEQARQAQRAAESFHALETASVRLGVMRSIGGRRLAAHLARLRSTYPGIDIEIHQAGAEDVVVRLDHGEFDLAIMNSAQHKRDRQHADLLYKERYVAAFPAGHRFESLQSVRLSDLSGEDYVDRLSCELRKQFAEVCETRSMELSPAARSDREDWTQELIVAGFGCAVLPEYSVSHPSVLTRPFVDPEIVRDVALVSVRGRPLSRPALVLKGALKSTSVPAA